MKAAWKSFDLKTFTDPRGSLTPMELRDYFEFDVKRAYTVHGNKEMRGGHAHIVEEEFFFMTSGSCIAEIHDGENWIEIELKANERGLYTGLMVWHQFKDFSEDGVMVALSSTNYNPDRSGYIESFEEFLSKKKAEKK